MSVFLFSYLTVLGGSNLKNNALWQQRPNIWLINKHDGAYENHVVGFHPEGEKSQTERVRTFLFT